MPDIKSKDVPEAIFNFATTLQLADGWTGVKAGDQKIYKALGKDLIECLFTGSDPAAWSALGSSYRQAWLDEIKRRIKGRELELLTKHGIDDETRYIMKHGAMAAGSAAPSRLLFSQFKCNEHFQSNYGNAPLWIANRTLAEVAVDLRAEPEKSIDFRISVSLIGGRWIAWNNRGFTTHCLANVPPMRIVPNPTPSEDEKNRLGEVIEIAQMNYSTSIPASRRTPAHWEATAPCTVISIVDGPQGKVVFYTVKNGFQRDSGNETAFNAL